MTHEADIFLTQHDLVARWRVSGRTLERWRAERHGPAWLTIGASIRYRMSDVLAWEAGQRSVGCAGANEIITNK